MTLILNDISIRNFLSVGNIEQKVYLDQTGLTLILGENLDQGGGGNRNGVGKTTIIQAICFAIYGIPLTNIKKDNLVNKINGKGLNVVLNFKYNNNSYRIERGRKPNFLKFYVNDGLVNTPDSDEAHGESKWTQYEIEKIFGMSHTLFKHLVALDTNTIPFLSLRTSEQREVIEELLGVTQLSLKADQLKEQIKQIRDEIKIEEVRIKTITDSNEKIQKAINDLKFKSVIWDKEHDKILKNLEKELLILNEIDIDQEILNHKNKRTWDEISLQVVNLEKEMRRHDKVILDLENNISIGKEQLFQINNKSCPVCSQSLHSHNHEQLMIEYENKINQYFSEQNQHVNERTLLDAELTKLMQSLNEFTSEPSCIYNSIDDAYNHRQVLETLKSEIARERNTENPYIDQIANLSTSGLQDVSYVYLNELIRLKEHQDFLLKLLINKDSFIRKKIIDQNINYLNHRLNFYLEKLNLPHEVIFKSDLSVEISLLGKEFDFEQLSNGEKNRLVLSLSWSFRDVWEELNHQMNILTIDELVDSGLDTSGTDASLSILKNIVRTSNKNIFLISHKDGLESRVDKVLLVQKESSFTTFLIDDD